MIQTLSSRLDLTAILTWALLVLLAAISVLSLLSLSYALLLSSIMIVSTCTTYLIALLKLIWLPTLQYHAIIQLSAHLFQLVNESTHPVIYNYRVSPSDHSYPLRSEVDDCIVCKCYITEQVAVYCEHVYCNACFKRCFASKDPMTHCPLDDIPIKPIGEDFYILETTRRQVAYLLLSVVADMSRIIGCASKLYHGPAFAMKWSSFGRLFELNVIVRSVVVLPLELYVLAVLARDYVEFGDSWWRAGRVHVRDAETVWRFVRAVAVHGVLVWMWSMY